MKRIFLTAAMSLAALSAVPALAADVGVSISVGQPGFYGHIDIGDYPQPRVIYREPRIVRPVPRGVVYEPVYLRVPPGQRKKWNKYCGRYDACGRPVYFVNDSWYNDVYVPRYRERHEHRDGRDGRGYDNDRRGDDRRDDDRGRGNGKGHGNGHGKGHDH